MHINRLFLSLLICLAPLTAQSQSKNSSESDEIQKEEFKHPQEKIEDDEKIHGFFEERELQEDLELRDEAEREIVSPAEPPIQD